MRRRTFSCGLTPVEIAADLDEGTSDEEDKFITIELPEDYIRKALVKRYDDSLDCLEFFITPSSRKSVDQITINVLLKAAEQARAKTNLNDALAIEDKRLPCLKKKLMLYWRSLNVLKYAIEGYCAHDFVNEDFPRDLLEVDHIADELALLTDFIEKFIVSSIPTDDFKQSFDEEKMQVTFIQKLIEKGDRERLAKLNILYEATPHVRLQHNKEVTDTELFEVVSESVKTDYGSFLWLVDNKPNLLLGRADLADCIIGAIHLKLVSKDQRPLSALMTIVPQMLKSLSKNELTTLSEKYIVNSTMKVPNWPEVLYQGYYMRWLRENKGRLNNTCIVSCKLLDTDSVEELAPFLLFCSLVAELGEGRFARVFDNSTDSFCLRIGRCLIAGLPQSKKELLLEALMSLPDPVRLRLLADGDYELSTSLYHAAQFLVTSLYRHPTYRDLLPVVMDGIGSLCKYVSPSRIVKEYIVPSMNSPDKPRAAVILTEMLKMERFKDEIANGGDFTLLDLTKLALEQYEEPDPAKGGKARYTFIEQLLNFVDSLLEGDVSQQIIDEIGNTLSNYNLTWYQYMVIQAICFPKSNSKFSKPKVPSIENTVESIKAANLTGLLLSWPGDEQGRTKVVFQNVVKDISSAVDNAMLVYVLLSATTDETLKTQSQYIKTFVNGLSRKISDSATNGNSDSANSSEWLKNLLNTTDLETDIREMVLSVAQKLKGYTNLFPKQKTEARQKTESRRSPDHKRGRRQASKRESEEKKTNSPKNNKGNKGREKSREKGFRRKRIL